MTTATIQGIKQIRYAPQPGEYQLSVNLGKADAVTVFEFAREIGVKPEIVQISTNSGIEIHALLLSEHRDHSPLSEESELSAKLDELATKIDPDAIRHVYGRLKAA